MLACSAMALTGHARANHRYKYKGENLGTYLVGLKKKDNPLLILKIKEMGFDLAKTDRSPENAAKKLPKNYLPRYWSYVNNLPRTPSLRIDKKLIKIETFKFYDFLKHKFTVLNRN